MAGLSGKGREYISLGYEAFLMKQLIRRRGLSLESRVASLSSCLQQHPPGLIGNRAAAEQEAGDGSADLIPEYPGPETGE
jgi:hypothetical protein